jgi:hypothetical protein
VLDVGTWQHGAAATTAMCFGVSAQEVVLRHTTVMSVAGVVRVVR